MYFIIFVLQLFGVFTSAMPRVTLLRVYFWLSIVSWVVLLGTTVLRVTLYFAKKDDIIWECMRLKEGDDLTYFNSWNPWAKSDKPMVPEEAIQWCGTWYSRALWLHVTVPLLILFLCGLFIILNHIYYHRVREEHIFSPTRLNKLKRETSLSAYGYGHGYGYGGGSGSGGEYHSSHYIPKSRTLSAQASASSDW
ncbi:hypothetical protein AX16_003564 [Volvariella volvacea WC 439]|nr:hypothetical protein AX16_003564 [Volvariella volvacea WC 439]